MSETYRFATAEDAAAVNGMLFSEYGDDYPYPLNESSFTDDHISLVCERAGEMIAFARAACHPRAYELGRLIIRPAFRGNGLARELTARRLAFVAQRAGEAIFAEPVCHREDCASQRNLATFGFVQTGIQLCRYPGILQHKMGDQPESVTFAVKRLNGPLDEHRPVCVPDDYREPLEAVLGRSLTNGIPPFDEAVPPAHYEPPLEVRGMQSIGILDIPVNFRGSCEAILRARSKGFVLCGLLLGMGRCVDGRRYDLLRMQRLPRGVRPNFGLVHVTEDLGPLLTHIRHELARA